MSTLKFLNGQIVLLVSTYGKNVVVKELARVLSLTEGELQESLSGIGVVKPKKAPLTKKVDPIDEFVLNNPSKAGELKKLYAEFNAKAFLPETKDVKRFLEVHTGVSGVKVKSRSEAVRKVLIVLSGLAVEDLKALIVERRDHGSSALGTISDQILK